MQNTNTCTCTFPNRREWRYSDADGHHIDEDLDYLCSL